MRVPRGLLCALCLGAAACPAPPRPVSPVDTPRGPRIHLTASEQRTPARLVLEMDPRHKPVGPALLHTFTFTLEEKVEAPEDGRARVHVRFDEVVGRSGEPQLSDQMALAMDDLKISFWRGARGEVTDLRIDGLHPPLDEATVEAIAFTLFGAWRGPMLPDKPVGPLDDWTIEADTMLVGLTVHQRYFYTLVAQTGSVIELREKGHVEGIATINGARRKLDGDTFSDEQLDLERGSISSGEYEWNATVDVEPWPAETIPGVGRTRVRVERGKLVQERRRRG